MEGERLATQRRAARESGLLGQSGNREAAAATAPAETVASPPAEKDRLALDPERDPDARQRNADFISARDKGSDINPHKVRAAPSPYILSAGSVIEVVAWIDDVKDGFEGKRRKI